MVLITLHLLASTSAALQLNQSANPVPFFWPGLCQYWTNKCCDTLTFGLSYDHAWTVKHILANDSLLWESMLGNPDVPHAIVRDPNSPLFV